MDAAGSMAATDGDVASHRDEDWVMDVPKKVAEAGASEKRGNLGRCNLTAVAAYKKARKFVLW